MKIAAATNTAQRPTWSREVWPSEASAPGGQLLKGLEWLAEDGSRSVLQVELKPHAVVERAQSVRLPNKTVSPSELLETVASLLDEGKARKAMARVYDAVDDWLFRRAEDECDRFLDMVEPAAHTPTLLVGILTITGTGRNKLARRADFVSRVRVHLDAVEPGRADALLAGLE